MQTGQTSLTLYQVDAFADRPFTGNPAAIVPLDAWLPDELMQAIAVENNLSETAYFVPTDKGFHIRWFTPGAEVDLCGHATLASAYVIFSLLGYEADEIPFQSRSGLLSVKKAGELLEMDFPAQPGTECEVPPQIPAAFGEMPAACLKSGDYIVVFDNEDSIYNASPKLSLLAELDLRGVAITARAGDYDFITRFFAPKYGINEDPVTGSAFTQLAPYWAGVLGKDQMQAKQVSPRGGEVGLRLSGDRVAISGKAVKYMTGTIEI